MAQPVHTDASEENPRSYVKQMAPRLIILAVMCVVLQALMALSYMGAFGKPEPKKAPFIVVSHSAGNAGYIANKLNAAENHPVLATISTDEKGSIEKVKRDEVVGVYVFNPSKTAKKQQDDLYYATAQGAARAQLSTTVAHRVASQAKRQVVTHDIVKAEPDDTRGTAAFYLVLAWLVGGYLLPSAMTTAVGARARTALGARLRLLLFAGYALLSGFVGTFLAQHVLDAMRGDYLLISLVGAAAVFTVATVAYAMTSLFGTMGIGLSILLFVIVGNPSSGGAFNYDVLPEPWRTVGPYLPNGASVDAVRSLAYFDGVNIKKPLIVLAVWLACSLWALFMVGNNTYRFAPGGESTPDDDTAGAVGEFVEHHIGHGHEHVGRHEASGRGEGLRSRPGDGRQAGDSGESDITEPGAPRS